MALDENTRKIFKEIINKVIGKIPEFMENIHRAKAVLNVNNEIDFVFGWIWGEINAAISMYYALSLEREVTQEEMMKFCKSSTAEHKKCVVLLKLNNILY